MEETQCKVVRLRSELKVEPCYHRGNDVWGGAILVRGADIHPDHVTVTFLPIWETLNWTSI